MHTSDYAFLAAATFAGITETANLLGEVTGSGASLFSVAQYGGTGGLIVALLFAVRALWQDRAKEHKSYQADRAELHRLLAEERASHRAEIAQIRQQHNHDLEAQTNRFIDELQRQIAASEAKERELSDEKYSEHNEQ